MCTVIKGNPSCAACSQRASVTRRKSDDDLFTWSGRSRPLSPGSVSISSARSAFLPFTTVHTSSGLPLNGRPQSRDAVPYVCQERDCFSALEILAGRINVAAGLRDPSSGHRGPEGGVRSGSSPRLPVVCLWKDRTVWNHSSQ